MNQERLFFAFTIALTVVLTGLAISAWLAGPAQGIGFTFLVGLIMYANIKMFRSTR